MYFMLTQYVFLLSICMFLTSQLHVVFACFLLLCCMFLSSMLHVFLVVSTHYFSRIYHYILFNSRIPFAPVFPRVLSLRDYCLHGRPSFAFFHLNPPLKRTLTLTLVSTLFFHFVCLLCMIVFFLCNGPSNRMC